MIQRQSWYWWGDPSWYATTYLGAQQLHTVDQLPWARPLFEAFVAGTWLLFWTDETVYWVRKPTVAVDERHRLHSEDRAACDSVIEPLYFWHGVMVDEQTILHPETLTVTQIVAEPNAEVRRVMMERYGWERFAHDADAKLIHRDDWGTLWELPGGPRVVEVVNSSPELDHSYKHYWLAVRRENQTARDAIASTWRKRDDPAARISGAEYAEMLVAQT